MTNAAFHLELDVGTWELCLSWVSTFQKNQKNRKNRFEKNSYQGGAIQTSLAIQHNSYVFALKTHSHKQSLRSALSESKKHTTVTAQIKSLQFYYSLGSVPTSWISNFGYVGLRWLPEWEVRVRWVFHRIHFWPPTY